MLHKIMMNSVKVAPLKPDNDSHFENLKHNSRPAKDNNNQFLHNHMHRESDGTDEVKQNGSPKANLGNEVSVTDDADDVDNPKQTIVDKIILDSDAASEGSPEQRPQLCFPDDVADPQNVNPEISNGSANPSHRDQEVPSRRRWRPYNPGVLEWDIFAENIPGTNVWSSMPQSWEDVVLTEAFDRHQPDSYLAACCGSHSCLVKVVNKGMLDTFLYNVVCEF